MLDYLLLVWVEWQALEKSQIFFGLQSTRAVRGISQISLHLPIYFMAQDIMSQPCNTALYIYWTEPLAHKARGSLLGFLIQVKLRNLWTANPPSC